MPGFSSLHVRKYTPYPLEYKGPYVRNWFSNFELDGHPITYRGRTTNCLEVAFVAAKNPDNTEFLQAVFTSGPGRAKGLGRNTSLRADWDNVCIAAMDYFLRQKWQPGTPVAYRLENSFYPLCEINGWKDRRWGCVLPSWEGHNALGLLLDIIKGELRTGTLLPGADEEHWEERQNELTEIMNSMESGIIIPPPYAAPVQPTLFGF